jgi:hypothetical protein
MREYVFKRSLTFRALSFESPRSVYMYKLEAINKHINFFFRFSDIFPFSNGKHWAAWPGVTADDTLYTPPNWLERWEKKSVKEIYGLSEIIFCLLISRLPIKRLHSSALYFLYECVS